VGTNQKTIKMAIIMEKTFVLWYVIHEDAGFPQNLKDMEQGNWI